MPGVSTDATYDPVEFRAAGDPVLFMPEPVTIEEGQDLDGGTVIGVCPTTGKYVAYDNDAVASATTPAAGDDNTGGGTISAVTVSDDDTLTENWTLECTSAGATGVFSVTGSVSGDIGDATVGTAFSDATGTGIGFTITDGSPDFQEGDTFTFSTTRAEALVAKKILAEAVDASDGDVISAGYVKGNFVYSKLTGIDSAAVSDLNGVYDSDTDRLRIN